MRHYWKQARSVCALLLAVIMIITMLPAGVVKINAATTKWNASGNYTTAALAGAGTEEDPYKITSAADLAKLAVDTTLAQGGHYFKITADTIDLSSHLWVAITTFTGHLDGNGCQITGFNYGTAADPYTSAGTFGIISTLSANSSVKNLSVEMEIYMNNTGATSIGGVVATCNGTVENCVSSGTISIVSTQNIYAGGLVKQTAAGAAIIDCANFADITVSTKGGTAADGGKMCVAGGIAAYAVTVPISNCVNYGDITAVMGQNVNTRAGGITGRHNNANVTITNCYNTGTITNQVNSSASYLGQITCSGATITNCYYTDSGVIKATAGGTVESVDALLTALNTNAGSITGANTWSKDAGGRLVPLVGVAAPVVVPEMSIHGSAVYGETLNAVLQNAGAGPFTYQWYQVGESDVAIEGATSESYTIQAADVGKILACVVSGGDIADSLRKITSQVAKADAPAAPAVTAVDASGDGVADGKITGTTAAMEYSTTKTFEEPVNCTDTETTGLVPGVYYVRIKGTDTQEAGVVTTVTVGPWRDKWTDEGNYTVTALSGAGTMEDPFLITSAADLAKLAVSYKTTDASKDKYFKITAATIDLSAHDWVPIENFAGYLDGNGVKITGLTIGKKSAPAEYVAAGMFGNIYTGGVVKNICLDVSIYTCWSTGGQTVRAGGIAANSRGVVDNCTVSGVVNVIARGNNININSFVGGVVGWARVDADSDTVVISNCVNHAEVTVYNDNMVNGGRYVKAGGIVGYMNALNNTTVSGVLVNCVNTGKVSAEGATPQRQAGGIAGYFGQEYSGDAFIINNCYSTGKITAKSAGNIAAQLGTVKAGNLYYSAESGTAANTADGNATVKDAADLKSADFRNTLDVNACSYNDQITIPLTRKWTENADGVLVPNGDLATDKVLLVTVNPSRYGTVKVEVQAPGSSTWVVAQLRTLVEAGSKVQLTIQPTVGCLLDTLTVAGQVVTVSENTYEFTINETTTAAVEYKVGETVDSDPIYVNPEAAATGDGKTAGSAFKTLDEAIAALTSRIENQPNINVTVYLMGENYTLTDTLKLTAAQSSLGRVTFKDYEDGKTPVISGGQSIPQGGFTKVNGKNYYSYQLPESAKVDDAWPESRTLLVNGKMATLARTDYLTFTKTYPNSVVSGYGIGSCDNRIFLDKDAMAGITDANSKNLEVLMFIEWKVQIYHLEDILATATDVEASIRKSEWDEWYAYDKTKRPLTGKTYYLQNHINFLDEPGEYYYDQETGTIYYYPYAGENMSTADVAYSTLDMLVDIDNASNITFDGIKFTGTSANVLNNGYIGQLGGVVFTYTGDVDGVNLPVAAIHGDYATGIVIQNCIFEELGGYGILMDNGISDLNIIGNTVRNVGLTGIRVGVNGTDITAPGASRNINISNNYVTNVGVTIPSAMGISVARCENLKILHNKIVHVPYSGISAGWGFKRFDTINQNTSLKNVEIAYNHVENFMMKINDGGGIYTSGPNNFTDLAELFNSVHDNYIKGNGNRGGCNGIYHDGCSSNFHTYNNVVVDVKNSLHTQDAVPGQYTYNLLVENNYTTHSVMSTSANADRNVVVKNHTHVADMSALPEAAKNIMAAAGLETAYKDNESPVDAYVVVTNPTVHLSIPDQKTPAKVELLITNHSDVTKTFTVSMMDDLLDNVKATFEGNGITLQPGESGTVTVILSIADGNKAEITAATSQGLVVTDQDGRITEYQRAFSLAITTSSSFNAVAYGTPTIDGVMDEIYRDSYRIPLGEVFHPSELATSDAKAYAYLVWDEDYLYCFITVNEGDVVSRGMELINEKNVNTIWASDTVETYISTTLRGSAMTTKFAVDAFGIMRYSNAASGRNTFEYHNSLPVKTAFTYNDKVIDGYSISSPTKDQNASTAEKPVNGYTIEMTLPINEITTLKESGKPQAGDQFTFSFQLNDYDGTYDTSGNVYVVAAKSATVTMTLACGHSNGEAKWTQTATTHSKAYDCCGEVVVEEEPHEWSDGKCAECGYACTHTGGTATCKDKAKCEVCGKEYGELAAHKPEADDGDCTTAIKCSVCGEVATEAKEDHTYGDDDICDVCQHQKPHVCGSGTLVKGKEASCTEEGLKDYYACSCGKKYWDAECSNPVADEKDLIIAKENHKDADRDGKCDHCSADVPAGTGDQTPLMLLATMLLLSAAAIVMVVTNKKRYI